MVDFTCELKHAITFAGSGDAKIGRICVFPVMPSSPLVTVVNLEEHPWCERPRRQSAFGVSMLTTYLDFKNKETRRDLRLRWYEFPISDREGTCASVSMLS